MRRFLVLLLLAAASIGEAQPPPLGPPVNRSNDGVEGATALSLKTITNNVRAKVTEALTSQATLKSVEARLHYRTFTTFPNRANSFFVRVYYSVDIEVSNPSFNRHIFLPIDVDVFCNDWQTRRGKVTLRVTPGPPSIEGGSITEEVITIRDDIDAGIKRAFTTPLPVSEQFPLKCATIGSNEFDILWDLPAPRRITEGVRVTPTIVVTFDSLKRLRARQFDGPIVYREVEDIILNAFANYSQVGKSLTMREGDQAALNLPALQLDARGLDNLVVIGSVEQPPGNPKDSAFAVAAKSASYSPGTHVLTIPKTYSQPGRKPQFFTVPAYELTYTVRFLDTGVLQQPGGSGKPALGGKTLQRLR